MNEENNNETNSQQQEIVKEEVKTNEKENKPTKKKRRGLFTLFACVMTAIIVFLAMNIGQQLSKGVEKSSSGSSNTESNSDSNRTNDCTATTTNSNQTIVFDITKSINSTNGEKYELVDSNNAGVYAKIDETQKVLKFSYTPAKVAKEYFLTWNSTETNLKTDEIKFEKKIVDLFFGELGQSSAGDTLFILLEDGTVEYIPLVHMFNHVQAAAVSYGAIKDVNGIVKFAIADQGDGVTTLGIKSDGSFYDLGNILMKTGNY